MEEGEPYNATSYRNPGVSAGEPQATDVYQVEIAVELLPMAGGVDGRVHLIAFGADSSLEVVILLHCPNLGNLKACEIAIGDRWGMLLELIESIKAEVKEEAL
jgi:hypothetical protein